MTYTPLKDEEVLLISDKYFNDREYRALSKDKPIALLVGAQPGAGKSEAARYAQRFLKEHGGYIRIDADRMRERLPKDKQSYPSHVTQSDAGRLVMSLRQKVVLDKKNFIEEA